MVYIWRRCKHVEVDAAGLVVRGHHRLHDFRNRLDQQLRRRALGYAYSYMIQVTIVSLDSLRLFCLRPMPATKRHKPKK